MGGDFTAEQKRFLEGFTSGIQVGRVRAPAMGRAAPAGPPAPSGPDAPHLVAQAKAEAAGKKLVDPEKWKREEHPFDVYHRLKEQAAKDEFPKAADTFRWKFYGLFYTAPNQDSFMCRLRIHNGILTHWQFAGIADLAERCAGGYAHVTTRANLQIRQIPARHSVTVIERIVDLGLASRGSGADNIRNVTGDATAGIAPDELIDTRPYAKDWHFHILNSRVLYGLPRKFNVAFDGGGPVPTLEDTNDIGFQAVVVTGGGIEPGVYFRLMLGGITGHKDIARDTGVILELDEATKVADAIVRVFIESGDRTDRNKARLKYVLDDWGFDKFLDAVELKLGKRMLRVAAEHVAPRPAQDRQAHIGVHPQKQKGLSYIGVVLPVGKMLCEQMHELAAIAHELGDGDIRLTVWQNLIISGIPDDKIEKAKARIESTGLDWRASSIRAGLVACTGSQGCKFANAATKVHAMRIADWCEPKVKLDQPVNIHLTGCPNSCAQHYIGDIGLVGARVPIEDDDTVDGYDIVVGGGFSDKPSIGRAIYPGVKAEDAPRHVAGLLKSYMAHRSGPDETFQAFSVRHEIEDLKALAEEGGMSFEAPIPTVAPIVPENAPFTPEQRDWLNGFFAGFLSQQTDDLQPISLEEALGGGGGGSAASSGEDDDGAPWHDPAMPIEERMTLAEGKPIQRRLMAAMAQQDCGQCGYDCHNYSKAIADGAEPKLNLCVPGGKETARKVKELAAELGSAPVADAKPEAKDGAAKAVVAPMDEGPRGYSRARPVDVVFEGRRRLNKADSEKSTFHIDIDLTEAGIAYAVGDSFGLFPENDPELVERVVAAIGAPRDFPIGDKSFVEYLTTEVSLGLAPDTLFELVSYITGGERRAKAKQLAKGDDPDGDIHTLDVLAVLEKFPNLRPDPEAFIECLDPLQPRLYSISSSHNATPGRVSLTVDHVRYLVGERTRRGVASSWLAERLPVGSKIKAYVQKAHNFGLPEKTDTPIIMVGPGTGVAPFRAFLHERKAAASKGGAWLFFGHQRRAADYFYEDEMEGFLGDGTLSKLSLAWSRDGERKTYVQDKMREDAAEMWSWLERGAHFYICGDAKRMASDVEKALTEIVAKEGRQDEATAKSFIAAMKKNGRYQADVY